MKYFFENHFICYHQVMVKYFQASLGRLLLAWGLSLTAIGYGLGRFNSTAIAIGGTMAGLA
jgi:hypothetical protein